MIVICEECKQEFKVRKDRPETKFCSRKCYNLGGRYKQKVALLCKYCGKEFQVLPNEVKKGRRFCSSSCSARARCNVPVGAKLKGSRYTIEYREWRQAVYMSDDYTCQKCGRVGGKLNAHHIAAYARYPNARHVIDNGITLCEDCHTEFHSLYGRLKFIPEDTWEYLKGDLET